MSFKATPYICTSKNYTPEELLESAKSDKLITSNDEFRELFIQRIKRFFDKDSDARVIYDDLITFLYERLNNKVPIKVDWFGTIEKQYVKRGNRYDVVTKKHVTSEYYLIKFVIDRRFAAFFINKENRQILMAKIMRRSVAFVREFGKVKLIGNK